MPTATFLNIHSSSSVNTNDAVYDSCSRQEASSSNTQHSGSGHSGDHESSKSSRKTRHRSKKGKKSSKIDAEKRQQQEEDLAGIGSQFENGDYQYAMNDGDLYDDGINHSPSRANEA
ncbi:hypothetical protein PG990_009061 [Apiospora arundinis]